MALTEKAHRVRRESLDTDFMEAVVLDKADEDLVERVMKEGTMSMTIEEEISQLQEDGLLDLSDHNDLPGMTGIEASDVGSLLEQFEEASQTLGDCDTLQPSLNTAMIPNDSENIDATDAKKAPLKEKNELTKEIVQKLKSVSKPKSTVMLPMGVPAKRGRGRAMARGRPVALPSNCTPRRLQRVMMQNEELRESIPLVGVSKETETVKGVISGKNTAGDTDFELNENYYELIVDHDYCRNVPVSRNSQADESSHNLKSADDNCLEEGEIIEEEEELPTESGGKQNTDNRVDPHKSNNWNKRNYRKWEETADENGNQKLFDKIPSYYTALSIPQKHLKKSNKGVISKSGISVHDFIPRDPSPVRETSMYNKLPDYHSTFTNSTKYDGYIGSNSGDKTDDSLLESRVSSSGYSSRSQTPLLIIDSRRPSRSPSQTQRSPSTSRSRCRSISKMSRSHRSEKRRSSYSSCSECSSSSSRSSSRSASRSRSRSSSYSSRSSSSSSSCSSSRSRSRDRSWKRDRNIRGLRRRYSSRSREMSCSRSRSRSPGYSRRTRRSKYSRYRSRSYSRSRSRSCSRSRSPYRRSGHSDRSRSRHRSREDRRLERKKAREEEKNRQIADRRIVYVGCIPRDYTKRMLRKRFERFGEIEEVGLHFREHGDNYGFVTYMYTCDAYAAIEKGNSVPGERERFDLCFGGRRQFCVTDYADLDGNKELQEEDPRPSSSAGMDFDELLKQARKKLQKS